MQVGLGLSGVLGLVGCSAYFPCAVYNGPERCVLGFRFWGFESSGRIPNAISGAFLHQGIVEDLGDGIYDAGY